MNCPTCKTKMKPLATGMYCVNDCDRIPQLSLDDMDTQPFLSVDKCPECGSTDIEPFDNNGGAALEHCWPCGRVWFARTPGGVNPFLTPIATIDDLGDGEG